MTTTATRTQPGPPVGDEPGERGRTAIAKRVVERIAAHAVTEVDGVGGAPRRRLGGTTVDGADLDQDATASAKVNDTSATLYLRLSVAYPASVAGVTEAARSHLRRRVTELTGLTVPRVDITVTALPDPARSTGRVH